MSLLGFYVQIVRALEELDIPYMLVGAFAGTAFGLTRATFDMDIVVDLQEPHFEALARRFPPPRYDADPEQMRQSVRLGLMFNIIDTEEGVKADLIPLSPQPIHQTAFARRVRRVFQDESGRTFEMWCARPEDIILGKLEAWQESRSAKHKNDIREMLVFLLSGLGKEDLDLAYISAQAARMGDDVLAAWNKLLRQAEEEIKTKPG